MTSWFNGLSQRERGLVFTALGLFVLMVGWMGIVRPMMNSANQADQAREAALRDLDVVATYLPKLTNKSNVNKSDFNRTVLIETARTSGLNISRVQPATDGGLRVWFEDVPSMSVYNCLQALVDGYNVEVSTAQITRRDSGLVSAQILLSPR